MVAGLLVNVQLEVWCLACGRYSEKSSPRQLWRSINVLLGHGGVPSCDKIDAQQFHDNFDAKVAGVRSSTDGASPPSFTSSASDVTISLVSSQSH